MVQTAEWYVLASRMQESKISNPSLVSMFLPRTVFLATVPGILIASTCHSRAFFPMMIGLCFFGNLSVFNFFLHSLFFVFLSFSLSLSLSLSLSPSRSFSCLFLFFSVPFLFSPFCCFVCQYPLSAFLYSILFSTFSQSPNLSLRIFQEFCYLSLISSSLSFFLALCAIFSLSLSRFFLSLLSLNFYLTPSPSPSFSSSFTFCLFLYPFFSLSLSLSTFHFA